MDAAVCLSHAYVVVGICLGGGGNPRYHGRNGNPALVEGCNGESYRVNNKIERLVNLGKLENLVSLAKIPNLIKLLKFPKLPTKQKNNLQTK